MCVCFAYKCVYIYDVCFRNMCVYIMFCIYVCIYIMWGYVCVLHIYMYIYIIC